MIFTKNHHIAYACSVIGHSHIKNGKPCQDASLCEQGKKYRFIAVADGHGGDPHFRSDLGSCFAIEALKSCLFDPTAGTVLKKLGVTQDTRTSEKEREKVILQMKKSVISRWNMLVAADIEAHPFTEEELSNVPDKEANAYRQGEYTESAYGSTLISVLWTDDFVLALHLGDGTCTFLSKEAEFSQPVPIDEKCFLNVTTSLCDKTAIDSFRHYYTKDQPAAVIIASDGIDDCFAGAEKLYDFYRVVLASFNEKDETTAQTELKDYFPRLSEKGSGDDISIGIILDSVLLNTLKFDTGDSKGESV